ncbi:3'-5' exonuclease [Kosakonia cowanii]|nr:3'-5' exonuclease [Kosakonia cowanii]
MAVYHSGRVETPEEKAQRWIKQNYVVVDTETTGLGRGAQIVEIAIVDCTGITLLNTLVKPTIPIPSAATAIHGITDEMVKDAPEWGDIEPEATKLLEHGWVAYNAEFDDFIISQSTIHDIDYPSPECAMELYAEHNGEWDVYRGRYKRKKLVNAAAAMSINQDGSAHRALYDCQMTLGVIRAIAGAAL